MNNSSIIQIRDTDKTKCEVCDYEGPCKLYATIVMCPRCLSKEIDAQQKVTETAEQRVEESRQSAQALIEKSLQIDQSIQIQQDIFNAKLVSINELKTAIDADGEIPPEEKYFTLAKTLAARFEHLNSVLHEISEKQKEMQTEQRAIQSYYNELAKKLRADEREQIKLRDVQYQPPIKPEKSPKAPKIKNYDKVSIKIAADGLRGKTPIPDAALESTLTMICVQRNISALEASRILVGNFSKKES